MPESQDIKDRIVAAREKLGLSQSQAGKAWGINYRTIQTWEQGGRRPTGLYLEKIEAILTKIGV